MNARLLADIGVLWCELAYGAHPVERAARPRSPSVRHAPWARFADPEPACRSTGQGPPLADGRRR